MHHIVLLLLLLLLILGKGPAYAQQNALPVLTRELSLQPTTSGTLTTLTNKSTGGGLIINTLPLTTNLGDEKVLLINGSNEVTQITLTNLFGATAWRLTGNGGTDSTAAFIGTPDETVGRPLIFKTDGVERMRLDGGGVLTTSKDIIVNGVSVGKGAGSVDSNTAVGAGALASNATGTRNTAIGYRAAHNGSNNGMVAIGFDAARFANGMNGTTAIGNYALSGTASQIPSGTDNTGVGRSAGQGTTTGSYNVFLGALSNLGHGEHNNSIVIGYNTVGLGSNTVVLGNSDIVTTALRGNVLINNSGASAGQVRFLEGSAGTDYAAIQSPASLAAPYTLTLPVNDGDANQVLTTDGSGTLSWSTVAQVSVAGTTDRVAKFTSASTIGNSRISDGSTTLTIGTENISSIEIGTAQTTGTITIGGTSGTGLISIGGGTSPSRADIEIGRNGYKWIQVGSESNADNRVILVGRGDAAVTAYGTFSVRPTQSDNSLVAPALRLMERHQGASFPNYVALKSPDDLAANYTLVFPDDDGSANQVLTTNGDGTLYWTTPLTSATGWSLTGNAGTNATTNFLGTTDNQDVVFKRQNVEAFRIATDGFLSGFATNWDITINGVRAGRGSRMGFPGHGTNTVFGSDALSNVIAGSLAEKNSAFGRRALFAITEGADNTAVGFQALEYSTTGSHNTALGSGAIGLSTTGSQNVAVGWRAMYTTGASDISSSTAVGYEAGRYINGANGLTAVGSGALRGTTTTSVTGTNNTALGLQAGTSVTTGSNNLFLGAESSIGTGSDNNSIVIGYNAIGIGSNTVVLGNSSIVTTALRGNVLINNSGASAGQVRFLEGSAGTDYAAIQAPASLAAPYTLTLPANDGDANQVLTTDGNGVLAWSTALTTSSGWSLSGNSITSSGGALGAAPTGSWLGTSNAQDLRLATNGLTRMIVASDGGITMGSTLGVIEGATMNSTLDVASTVTLTSLSGAARSTVPSGYNRIVIANNLGNLEQASISSVVAAGVPGSAWALAGNTGTTDGGTLGNAPSGNIIGTTGTSTNARNLSFVTNNVIQAQIGTDSVFRVYRDMVINGVTVGSATPVSGVPTNAVLGVEALKLNVSSFANVAIGNKAMRNLTSGLDNVAIGANALFTTPYSADNTAIGSSALYKLNVQFNTAPFGDKNVAIGTSALYNLPSGVGNIAIGSSAMVNESSGGSYNTAIGVEAGANTSTSGLVDNSANSVFIGAFAGPKATAETNQIVIGYLTNGNGSNTVTIGNDSIVATHLRGHLNLTYPASTTIAPELRLYEPSTSGTNYTAFKAQAQSANVIYTLPAADGTANQMLTTNGSGVLSWTNPASGVTSFSAGTTGLTPNTATTGAVTLAGTLNVANGGTGATTLTGVVLGNGTSAMTATSTSSGIATAISDETGSGALVFGTSPTLTTLTVSSGGAAVTGNSSVTGSFNLSGTTSPLQANGSAGTSGQVLTSAGAGATPTWTSATSAAGIKSKGVSTLQTAQNTYDVTLSTLDAGDAITVTLEGADANAVIPSFFVVRTVSSKFTVYFSAPFTGYINWTVMD